MNRVENNTVPDRNGRPKVVLVMDTPTARSDRTIQQTIDVDALSDPAVAKRLQYYRKLAGVAPEALAKRAGVAPEDVLRAERRPEAVSFGTLAKICDALHISFEQITETDLVLAGI